MVNKQPLDTTDILGIDLLIGQAEGFVANKPRPKYWGKGFGKPFFKQKFIHRRGYWYILQNIRENGKWKQVMLAYCGARKPRGNPEGWLSNHGSKK